MFHSMYDPRADTVYDAYDDWLAEQERQRGGGGGTTGGGTRPTGGGTSLTYTQQRSAEQLAAGWQRNPPPDSIPIGQGMVSSRGQTWHQDPSTLNWAPGYATTRTETQMAVANQRGASTAPTLLDRAQQAVAVQNQVQGGGAVQPMQRENANLANLTGLPGMLGPTTSPQFPGMEQFNQPGIGFPQEGFREMRTPAADLNTLVGASATRGTNGPQIQAPPAGGLFPSTTGAITPGRANEFVFGGASPRTVGAATQIPSIPFQVPTGYQQGTGFTQTGPAGGYFQSFGIPINVGPAGAGVLTLTGPQTVHGFNGSPGFNPTMFGATFGRDLSEDPATRAVEVTALQAWQNQLGAAGLTPQQALAAMTTPDQGWISSGQPGLYGYGQALPQGAAGPYAQQLAALSQLPPATQSPASYGANLQPGGERTPSTANNPINPATGSPYGAVYGPFVPGSTAGTQTQGAPTGGFVNPDTGVQNDMNGDGIADFALGGTIMTRGGGLFSRPSLDRIMNIYPRRPMMMAGGGGVGVMRPFGGQRNLITNEPLYLVGANSGTVQGMVGEDGTGDGRPDQELLRIRGPMMQVMPLHRTAMGNGPAMRTMTGMAGGGQVSVAAPSGWPGGVSQLLGIPLWSAGPRTPQESAAQALRRLWPGVEMWQPWMTQAWSPAAGYPAMEAAAPSGGFVTMQAGGTVDTTAANYNPLDPNIIKPWEQAAQENAARQHLRETIDEPRRRAAGLIANSATAMDVLSGNAPETTLGPGSYYSTDKQVNRVIGDILGAQSEYRGLGAPEDINALYGQVGTIGTQLDAYDRIRQLELQQEGEIARNEVEKQQAAAQYQSYLAQVEAAQNAFNTAQAQYNMETANGALPSAETTQAYLNANARLQETLANRDAAQARANSDSPQLLALRAEIAAMQQQVAGTTEAGLRTQMGQLNVRLSNQNRRTQLGNQVQNLASLGVPNLASPPRPVQQGAAA